MRLNTAAAALLAVLLGAGPLSAQQQRNPWDDLLAPRPSFPPPQQQRPPQPQQPPAAPGGVQSEPLPPPQTGREIPDIAAPPLTREERRQERQDRRGKGRQQEPAEVTPERPQQERIANPTAVFSGLDKITGRIFPFEAAIDETVQFGALQVTPRACYTRPPTEPQNTTGFIEVDEITLDAKVRRIFSGWMFAASPGLNAVEHAIYDVWLVDCKQTPPEVAKSKS